MRVLFHRALTIRRATQHVLHLGREGERKGRREGVREGREGGREEAREGRREGEG